MKSPENLVVVNIRTAKLDNQRVRSLWRTVPGFCIERGVDGAAIELDARPPSRRLRDLYGRLEKLLQANPGSGLVRVTSELLETLVDAGPRVVSLNLYGEESWWGGMYDWGHDIAVLLDRDDWCALCELLEAEGRLPEWDLEEVIERPRYPSD